jgi:competence protein ComEC
MVEGMVPAGATAVLVGTYAGSPAAFRVTHARVIGTHRVWRFAARHRLAARFTELYGGRAPLIHALTLDRKADLDPRLRRAFADSGLAHLLAISGLHVALIAGWVVMAAGWLLGRRHAWVAAACASWGYVALLGLPAPATRSAVFISLKALTGLRQRHPSDGTILSVSALVVLAIDPGAVTDLGAWLSFSAVWGTQRAAAVLSPAWRRRQPAVLLATSVGATIATAPITAFAFGAVPLVGILANLVAIPLSAVALPGVFVSLASHTLAGGAGLALAALERVADLAAAVPGGRITGVPGAAFAVPWLLALLATVWLINGGKAARRWGVGWRPVAYAASAGWALATLPPAFSRVEQERLVLYFLDVGQGDAIAVQTPRGRWMMVDAGPRTLRGDAGRRVVLPFLRRHGVRQLDVLVVTHGDADHLGGAPALERTLAPSLVLEPGQPLGTRLYLEHLVAVDAEGTRWSPTREGDSFLLDSVAVTVLHPSDSWIATQLEPNENSVVLRLRYRGFVALLTGDAGHVTEERLLPAVGRAHLLKVGHHGSAGSTGEAWLETVRPGAAVVSVGQNRYGHPDPGVLARLERRGVAVFRTDKGGTVTVRSDGRYFDITQGGPTTWLEALRCRVPILSRSSGSSSSRNACTPPRRASFPISSMTLPSPPRSSPAM